LLIIVDDGVRVIWWSVL